MAAREGSFLGKIFRSLADFFDRHHKRGTPLWAGSAREVDIVTLAIVFIGLVTAGTWIHGWHFLLWNILFAAIFCGGTWLIFHSARWRTPARVFLFALVLLLSLVAATERVMALSAFVLLFLFMLRGALSYSPDFFRRETLSVIAVALFCFSAYNGFAGVLEWRRSAGLQLGRGISLQCTSDLSEIWPNKLSRILSEIWLKKRYEVLSEIWFEQQRETNCKAGEVAFSVPDFWRRGQGSNLIKDLASIAHLKIYADGATDNSVAFASYAAPANQVIQQISSFLSVQKGFLRSKGMNGDALVPQQMMKAADTWLYAVRYQSATAPGYLAGSEEMTALILLHERRGTTWLFIVDGTDLSAREFILHRIISGFR